MFVRYGVALGAIAALVAAAVTAFGWPSASLEPRDLPLGAVGRAPAPEGSFALHRYPDAGAARRAIEDREVYGALVAGSSRPVVLTASAASPAVAQLLETAAGPGARVVDVVPAPPRDRRGAAFGTLVLPFTLISVIVALATLTLARGALGRMAMIGAAAALAGLVAVAVVQGWLDVLRGPWLVNAAVIGLAVLAIGGAVAGLAALLGQPGLALGGAIMVFLGNPWSAVSTAPELLPPAAGAIGQLLPPGAAGGLLRSTAFFGGAGGAGHLIVLLVWSLLGAGALLLASRFGRPGLALPARASAP